MRSVNSSNNSGLQVQKMQKNGSIKTDIHNQETSEDSEKKFIEFWE
jgi:hypothetical protein